MVYWSQDQCKDDIVFLILKKEKLIKYMENNDVTYIWRIN